MALVILRATCSRAVGALLITASFIPLGQQIVFLGLHLYFLRILILVCLVRLTTRGELNGLIFTTIDKLFLGWVATGVTCSVLRGPSAETFGWAYDCLGVYFSIRILTERSGNDVASHVRTLALVAMAMAAFMAFERLTHRNLFHFLGGVPEVPSERDERFRAQGPFRHAILAGTFGATTLPLVIGLQFQRNATRTKAILGGLACIVITLASASSGPLMSFLGAVIGLVLWPFRFKMRFIRRGLLLMLLGLALVMNAPVWYLIGRLSEITGGTGFYRSFLIEQAIKHFGEWWLIGSSRTAHWSPWESNVLVFDPNNIDITNHYIVQGLHGGILMLGLFVSMIVVCYKTIGSWARDPESSTNAKLMWGAGAALTAHCLAFISVSYFDQIKVFWFWLLAVISAMSCQGPGMASQEPQLHADVEKAPLVATLEGSEGARM
ncbi:MAG TPA: hypothetical protein VFE51_20410 [Verrucomicrobiae bacterium]|nr:hypothetical protein [Verrucomicrobiae bacterium]